MLDCIKQLDIDFIAANPGSSFRGLHESIVNYGGNKKPELITCLHEETSVAIAHGYAKAAGKPMAVMAHSTVGLQHAAMAVYNAWCDRVPILLFIGNPLDGNRRRGFVEWVHAAQDPAALVRDFTKWDDQPGSLQHFSESLSRAYRLAVSAPMAPVVLSLDAGLQELPITNESRLRVKGPDHAVPPQADISALREAAALLLGAANPLIIADRAARTPAGMKYLVDLADAVGCPVIDLGGRTNFPNTHYLSRSDDRRSLVRNADVVLLLEVGDQWGQFNAMSDPAYEHAYLGKVDAKIISISVADGLIKANYQDFQRYMPANLSISGDVEASLPPLTEAIKVAATDSHRSAIEARRPKLEAAYRQMKTRAREAAAVGWDSSPVSTARVAMELWDAIRNEKWCLGFQEQSGWTRRLWDAPEHYNYVGFSGGAGVGCGAPHSVGAALANRDKGIITVNFQSDGDLMYAPGILWTAAHHHIPLLTVMHNNRCYHQEIMHIQRMAGLYGRPMDTAKIGNAIENPNIDYAALAKSMGVWAEGPISDPNAVGPAIKRALAVVKRGEPALVDVITQGR